MAFTPEQRAVVETGGVVPITIDGLECVVLRADQYAKLRTVFSEGCRHDELRAMLAHSSQASDWLDPTMDIYDAYDKHRANSPSRPS